jgi:CRP/FNR family cyclic AMP-dependent transcriptional regulator
MSSYTEKNSKVPEMQENLELLQNVPFFSAIPFKALKLLAFLATREHFGPEDILYEKGDNQGRAYLVLSGELLLLRKNDKEKAVALRYTEGDYLGTFSLLGSMPSLFVLQAATKATVLTITREQFAKVLEQFPETAKFALKALLKELHQWERKNIAEAGKCCLGKTGATVL